MIIGLTGQNAAGKGSVANYLKAKGFEYCSLSDVLREEANKRGIVITRDSLQFLGNSLRAEFSNSVLADMVIERLEDNKSYVIDSIRNPSEAEALKKLRGFVLVNVEAPLEIRFERIKARGRENDPKNLEEFRLIEEIENSQDDAGLRIKECQEMADRVLLNIGELKELEARINAMLDSLGEGYRRPDWDEYFMEIAETVAKRATCDRGRAGTVIARDKRILVTGYVGSPTGLPHCDEAGHQMKSMIHEDGRVTQHCVRTTHSEQNAIAQAARNGISIEGATLYCKMTPCSVCAKIIINSGIKRVVCKNRYHVGDESIELFKQAGVEIVHFDDSVVKYERQ
jgi:dCMP deaminase